MLLGTVSFDISDMHIQVSHLECGMNCRVDKDADGKLNEGEVREVEFRFF